MPGATRPTGGFTRAVAATAGVLLSGALLLAMFDPGAAQRRSDGRRDDLRAACVIACVDHPHGHRVVIVTASSSSSSLSSPSASSSGSGSGSGSGSVRGSERSVSPG